MSNLLIVDPQNDFCDPKGSLFVKGADEDMARLAGMISRFFERFNKIFVTLDSHHRFDIGHPGYWVDQQQNHPAPFTAITLSDVLNRKWRPVMGNTSWALQYVEAVGTSMVWPEHCLVGSWGHNIPEPLSRALGEWEVRRQRPVEYVIKGLNPHTEHYSAVRAAVPVKDDRDTWANLEFVHALSNDFLMVAGEAGSHCVRDTVNDLVSLGEACYGKEQKENIVLLKDAISPVPGFEKQHEEFISAYRGAKTEDYV